MASTIQLPNAADALRASNILNDGAAPSVIITDQPANDISDPVGLMILDGISEALPVDESLDDSAVGSKGPCEAMDA